MDRAELQKRLYVHEMVMPADEYQASMAAPAFGEALRARMIALGADAPAAEALQARAAVPGTRGLGALDAAIRSSRWRNRASPAAAALLLAAYACALDERLRGRRADPPQALVGAARAERGSRTRRRCSVRGAVLLAIDKRAPAADAEKGEA